MKVIAKKQEQIISIEIDKAQKAGMNMLLPSSHIESLSQFHSPVIDHVSLSPEPTDGDVYFHKESSKFVPSKQGLMKLAVCAGISWHPTETRRVDNRQDRNYVSYVATGGVRKSDGEMVWIKAEWDMDFEVIEDELRNQYEASGKRKKKTGAELQNYVDYCVRRDLLYRRKHKVKLCEAGAMNRVIRSLLGLKSGYTEEELRKPFCIARIVFRPDYDDPEIRKAITQKSIESITGIYGNGNSNKPTLKEVPPIEIPPEEEPEPTATSNIDPEASADEPEEELTSQKADFMAADIDTQVHILQTLAQKKGYNMGTLKKPLTKFSESERDAFYDRLIEMMDDDMPF